ncbi:MAG: GGDEF domain-containing protein [Nitrospirae bacterium]|nr:GGDEF domain-containing protein [Nitrospirota bacterium]
MKNIIERLRNDLRNFVELSLEESDDSWKQWLSLVNKDVKIKCWEKKRCDEKACPAYMNSCSRCWLIAGTVCGGEPQGKFAKKYGDCIECDVYREAVLSDPVNEVYEHLITLVHSLRFNQQELKALAMHDLLTGLHNRNFMDMFMTKEIKKIKRYGGELTIYMLDINNFKHLNDTYGHIHGDGVLKEFSSILRKSIRDTDELIRYGGDEFLIIAHENSCRDNDLMMARINENIAGWNDRYGSEGYCLSFSYGSAVFNKGSSLAQVIEEADKLMYKNKKVNKKT